MCEPVTIATLAVTAVSTAVGMYAQNQQQKAQSKAANQAATAQMQAAENDRAAQMQLAQNENAKTAAELDRHRRMAVREMGSMRSALGASGIEIDSGTNLSMLGENAQELQYDANIIAQNGAMNAHQYLVGATAAENDYAFAKYQKSQAGSDSNASLLGMGGTLLGGIASGLSTYNGYAASSGGGNTGSTGGSSAVSFGNASGVSSTWSKNNPYAHIKW